MCLGGRIFHLTEAQIYLDKSLCFSSAPPSCSKEISTVLLYLFGSIHLSALRRSSSGSEPFVNGGLFELMG